MEQRKAILADKADGGVLAVYGAVWQSEGPSSNPSAPNPFAFLLRVRREAAGAPAKRKASEASLSRVGKGLQATFRVNKPTRSPRSGVRLACEGRAKRGLHAPARPASSGHVSDLPRGEGPGRRDGGGEGVRNGIGREAAGALPEGLRLASEGRAKRGLHEPADLQALIQPMTLRGEEYKMKKIRKKSGKIGKNQEKSEKIGENNLEVSITLPLAHAPS